MFIRRFIRTGLYACLITTTTLAGGIAGAAPLTLDEALRHAVELDASLTRIEALADARDERAVAEGALPDPEIVAGYRNLPAGDLSTTADPMTMLEFGVRQAFPPGRTRELARDRGGHEAAAMRAERAARLLEIRREVRHAWLDWRHAWRALDAARDAADEFAPLVELIERRVASGIAHQRDLYRARLEHAALEERVIELGSRVDSAAAGLARWLDTPLAGRSPGEEPGWPALRRERLDEALASHPELEAPEYRIRAARTGVERARADYRPAWMAEVSYGARAGGRKDMVSGMVSLSVPLFTRDRQDRRMAGALRELDAIEAEREDRLRRLKGELDRHWSLFVRLDELLEYHRSHLLPGAADTSEATLTAYRNDRASVDELVRARVDELEYRLRALEAGRRLDGARVDLLYLAGE